MDNKDDTLSMYYNETRISGERMSYSLIRHWMMSNGVEMPCICCKYPRLNREHNSHHEHKHDEGDDDGEDDGEDSDAESADYDDGQSDYECVWRR